MQAFYVDDVRTGKAIPTRIARVDGQPMGAAGVWSRCDGSGNGRGAAELRHA